MTTKNYVITGATSYLGREIINYLSLDENNKIIAISRKSQKNEAYTNNANVHRLEGIDLLVKDCLAIMTEKVKMLFNESFHVINCTGYYKGQKDFEKVSFEESNEIFESNYTTVYNTALYLLPLIKDRKGGHFIGFSCNSVRFNYPQMAPFTAAKSALESLIRTIANEQYAFGVIANSFQLSTLLTEHEVEVKPNGDHENWLKPIEVAYYIESFIQQPMPISNGNSINLYHHSDSFFNKSYFERIKND